MNYLVSATNSPYTQWQLELLINSAKELNVEDKLFIGISQGDSASHNYQFTESIANHENKFYFENIGQKRGYEDLNQLYFLSWAMKNKKVEEKILVMPTHSVIRNKTTPNVEDYNYSSILISTDPFFTFESACQAVPEFWKLCQKDKEYYEENWVPFGPYYFLNKIPSEFIDRIALFAERLILQQILDGNSVWENTIRLAWAVQIAEQLGKISITGTYNMTTSMIEDKNCPIINYEHGMPPVFNKEMYLFPPPFNFSFGDPIEKLKECINTENAHYISKIAEKIIAKRKK